MARLPHPPPRAAPIPAAAAVRLWRDEASAAEGWCAAVGLPDDARAHVAQTLAGEVGAVQLALFTNDVCY